MNIKGLLGTIISFQILTAHYVQEYYYVPIAILMP